MGALEIAVAGCGPAGMAAALLLHREGHRVTIFERFETPRPIGSGLMIQPTGRAVLRALGLEKEVLAHGARIDRLVGEADRSGRKVLDVRYAALRRADGFGVGIHRATLFAILYEAVAMDSIPLSTGHTVRSCRADANGRRRLLFESGGSEGHFDLIVDALGTRSPLAPPSGRDLAYGALWATLDWPEQTGFIETALQQRYRAASIMAGILPIGVLPGEQRKKAAFFWSLRADKLQAWGNSGLEIWKTQVEELWPETRPLLGQLHLPDHLTFARYAHRTLRAPTESGLVHIGDAWHSASPQLGQGANMALLDAYALMLGLRRETDLVAALEHAIALRRRHVDLYQALTAIFTPVYQSDSQSIPLIRDRLVGPLSKLWPATWIQAAMVSGLIGNPLTPLKLNG